MASQRELAKFVRLLCHVEGSDQEIFSRPDIVRLVCEQTLKIVLNVDVHDVQPAFSSTDHESHRDALQELAFIKYCTRMCLDFGIDFEPTRDLYSHAPDPKRVTYILQKIVNFLNFREREVGTYIQKWGEYMQSYSEMSERMERLKPEIDTDECALRMASERRAQMEAKVASLQQELARAEADDMQPRIDTHKALERRFGELRAALDAAEQQLDSSRMQAISVQQECAGLRVLVEEPPEKLREASALLRRQIEMLKAELAELDQKAQALGTRKACLLKIASTLDKMLARLQQMDELRARHKQTKKSSKERAAECATLESQCDKAEKHLSTARSVRLPAISEKEEKLARQREERQRQFAADLERAKQEAANASAEVLELRAQAAALLQQAGDTQQATETEAQRHASDVARAQEAVAVLSEQVAAYHEELFAAMEAAAALEHC